MLPERFPCKYIFIAILETGKLNVQEEDGHKSFLASERVMNNSLNWESRNTTTSCIQTQTAYKAVKEIQSDTQCLRLSFRNYIN
jgi:hypothetical protein